MTNKISRLLLFFLLILLFDVAGSSPLRRILKGGKVVIGNGKGTAEAIVIEGDRILFVGSNKIAENFNRGKKTVVTDLKGKLVIPGFHDGDQNFLLGAGLLGNRLNFYGLDLEVIIHRLKNEKKRIPNGVIYGYNFEHLLSKTGNWPSKYDLDKVSEDSPVIIFSSDGSHAWVNSFTLKQFGINKNTPPVSGGKIIRFDDNNPSGILIGKAIELIKKFSFDESIKKIRPGKAKILSAIKYANSFGLTSITTDGDLEFTKQLKELESEKNFTLRFNIILPSKNIGRYLIKKIGFSSDSPHVRIISVSKKIDGNLYSSSAALFSKYMDGENYGFLTTNINDISDLVSLYKKNGIIANFRAEGDRGVHVVLNGIKTAIRRSSKDKEKRRLSNFHFAIDEDIVRFKKLNIIPIMRPASFMDRAVSIEKQVGQRKAGNALKTGTMQNLGIKIAFGSGWPGGSIDPLKGIDFAVFRRIRENRGKENRWFVEEKLSFVDAIRAYTYNPSYSVSDETQTGSIEKGKYADIVILEGDILSDIKGGELFSSSVRVFETIIAGETVYKKEISN